MSIFVDYHESVTNGRSDWPETLNEKVVWVSIVEEEEEEEDVVEEEEEKEEEKEEE